MSSLSAILLQGGTVLIHDSDNHVRSVKADVLIKGNIIAEITADMQPTSDTQVIDCRDKIITPGFIDTHHHVWQTLLKGRHANQLLLDYFPDGNFTSALHNEADFYWGELGGALECLDAGTTTVVDFAHLNYSPAHTKAAIAATISSGIRSTFCYCPTLVLESWEPFTLTHDMLEDWVMNTLEELASKAPFGDGRVQLGLSFDGLFLPKETVVSLFEKSKALGIKLITIHYVPVAIQPPFSAVELLHSYGLLDSTILFSHASNASAKDAELIRATNSHVSTTPSTELQMAMGEPAAFHSTLNIHSQCSVGIDCHSNQSASIPSELRLLLQSSRAIYNQKFVEAGKYPTEVNRTVEEAFNLGTVSGAKAIGMQDKIGTLKVGYLADIVVWDALSPAMVCAAQHDPVAAVILHSSPRDIDMVIVDGIVRKRGGKLVDVDVRTGREIWDGKEIVADVLEWNDVSRELVKRRELLQEKVKEIDMKAAKKGVMKAFYVDETVIVDSV